MYSNPYGLRPAFATLANLQTDQVFFTNAPHELALPPGVESDLAPWDWYRQQYSQLAAEPPTPEAVAEWAPPAPEAPEPLTDVEIAIRGAAENFEKARLAAPKALDRLKGTIHTALVSGGMSSGEATAAGVGLVLLHGPLLAAFEAAGGHPVAGQALYDAISSQESVAALPWLSEPILAIFAAALVPQ